MRFPFEPPPAREFDAVGFGLNAVDYLVVVPHYPAYDTKVRLVEHERGAGGETASAMTGLRRLGMRTAYAGRFGSDMEGYTRAKTALIQEIMDRAADEAGEAREEVREP